MSVFRLNRFFLASLSTFLYFSSLNVDLYAEGILRVWTQNTFEDSAITETAKIPANYWNTSISTSSLSVSSPCPALGVDVEDWFQLGNRDFILDRLQNKFPFVITKALLSFDEIKAMDLKKFRVQVYAGGDHIGCGGPLTDPYLKFFAGCAATIGLDWSEKNWEKNYKSHSILLPDDGNFAGIAFMDLNATTCEGPLYLFMRTYYGTRSININSLDVSIYKIQ